MLLSLHNVFAVASCGVGALLVVNLFLALFSPLRRVPGPFWARFTDGWYFWRLALGRFEMDNIKLHQKYGRVVRYGPNRYSFNDPSAAKIIYGLGTHFPKSSWYSSWSNPGQWSIFADQDVPRHTHTRRLMQSAYSMSALVTYEPFVDECASIFNSRMDELCGTSLPFDMGHWLQCYAFDVIGYMTYSKRLGFLDHGEDINGVIAALEDHLVYASLIGIFPWLHSPLWHLRNLFAGGKGKGRAYVLNFTSERISEHKARAKAEVPGSDTSSQLLDFLSKFYSRHSANPDVFTMYHLLTGCATNMVAGSDTTAITLSAILYYLLKHPKCLEKLRLEVSQIQTLQEAGTISFQQTQEMPYLQAVIKEGLRMHPATGLPLERVVPEGGTTVSGHYFPAGSIVGINTWVEHRNPEIFGPDADVFRPERWLTEDQDKLSYMNRHWMPFGLGSRTCLGRHISLLEISKLIPRLVNDYDFELCQPIMSWKTTNFWFVKPRDFMVKISSRRSASSSTGLMVDL
ncbi:cytochrome P450 [Thozetella sp. PMI_491]|nr:cytochrome P450 [Thozetella sp. PMI_491]